MNYRGALCLLTGVGDIVYPGLALDGLQCKAAQAGRGYEITAWGGWQDKREMRLAVYPLSSEKRYCPDYFLLYELGIYCMDSRRETFFLVESLATTHGKPYRPILSSCRGTGPDFQH